MRKNMNNPNHKLNVFFDFAHLFGPVRPSKPTKGAFGQSKGQKRNRKAKRGY